MDKELKSILEAALRRLSEGLGAEAVLEDMMEELREEGLVE